MGKLIVIEGLDGSGKSTQLDLLPQSLKNMGIDCKSVSFPDYDSRSSELVKMYVTALFDKMFAEHAMLPSGKTELEYKDVSCWGIRQPSR